MESWVIEKVGNVGVKEVGSKDFDTFLTVPSGGESLSVVGSNIN